MKTNLLHGAIYPGLFLTAGMLSLLLINITNTYYNFFDIGINAAANSFGLMLFCLPVTFFSIIGTASGVYYIARKRKIAAGKAFLLSFSSMLCVAIVLFWLNVLSLADYPKYPGRNFSDFLHYLWENNIKIQPR